MYQLYQTPRAREMEYHYRPHFETDDQIVCDWDALRMQLLHQWHRLSPAEVDSAGPDRRRLARLVERKYGIAVDCVENYLRNFERTLPL